MKSVLVVEDDIETRDTIAALLDDEGYAVRVASDGACALAHLASGEVGLALVNLLMPRMNGWTLLQKLSDHEMLGRVPVVVLTAWSKVSLPISVPVLRKPFELDALLEIVRRSFVGSLQHNDDKVSRPSPGVGFRSHGDLPPVRSPRASGVYPLRLAKCADFVATPALPCAPARRS